MNLYTLALFIHLLGLIAMFGAFVLLQNSGRRLRAATTWQEARPWLDLLRSITGMMVGGTAMILASGLYMAHALWSFGTSWVVVGIVAAVLLAIAHPLMVGRRLTELRRMAEENRGVLSPEGRVMLQGPALWSAVFAMNGAALGIVWLMSTKPGWTESVLVPFGLAGVGSLIGARLASSRGAAPSKEHPEYPVASHQPLARGRRTG